MPTTFIPSDNLKHYVEAGELRTARSALLMELNDTAHDAVDLRAAHAWTVSRVSNLYDAYAESAFARPLNKDEAYWTENYFGTQLEYLKANFCQDRFLHLVNVRQKLRNAGAARFRPVAVAEIGSNAFSSRTHSGNPGGANRQPPYSRSSGALSPIARAVLLAGGAAAALALFLLVLGK